MDIDSISYEGLSADDAQTHLNDILQSEEYWNDEDERHGEYREAAEKLREIIDGGSDELKEAEAMLRQEFGDGYKAVLDEAREAVGVVSDEFPEVYDLLENGTIDGVPAGNHPAVVKLFRDIGRAIRQASPEQFLQGGGLTRERLLELMRSPEYSNPALPGHEEIFRAVTKGWQQLVGTQSAATHYIAPGGVVGKK